jgi:hypothetical protein
MSAAKAVVPISPSAAIEEMTSFFMPAPQKHAESSAIYTMGLAGDLSPIHRGEEYNSSMRGGKSRSFTAVARRSHLYRGLPRTQDVQAKALIWANGTGLHPGIKERAGLRLRAGRWLAVRSGGRGPTNQMIGADVMDDVFQRAAAVGRRILDLRADLSERLAFPAHLARREMPPRIARQPAGLEIRLLIGTRVATTSGD